MKDLIIIGGGASGVATAIMVKEQNPNISVLIIEQNDRILKKLALTGNGRCNILNKNISENNYHGTGKATAFSLIDRFNIKQQEQFFKTIGLPIVYEGSKGFPMSKQASSVVDCLRFRAEELGIETVFNTTVKSVTKQNNKFVVKTENETFYSKTLSIACGSIAGGKLGTDSGYMLLKSFGHKILERRAAIVQIKTDTRHISSLKGIKVNAECGIFVNNKKIKSEYGEVLFCDYGLSGPPILQLSRIASFNKNATISIDFFNQYSAEELELILKSRKFNLKNRTVSEFFTGMINKRLGQTVIKRCEIELKKSVFELTDKEIKKIALLLKNYTVTTNGTTGMSNAQVCAGGADVSEFDNNLMSKKISGLFSTGEVLDIDGDCGGYNLSYCWAAANSVAKAVNLFLGQ